MFIKSGTYNETTLEINKSVSLIGQDPLTTVMILTPRFIKVNTNIPFYYGSHFEDALNIQAPNVRISGLTIINNQEGGNTMISGNGDQITNNTIITNNVWLSSFQVFAQNTLINSSITFFGANTTIAANTIENGYIYLGVGSENVVVYGNGLFGDGEDGGIGVLGNASIVFHNTVRGSIKGITTVGEASGNIVCANIISGCSIGLEAFTENDNNIFFGNEVANNSCGVNAAEIWSIGKNQIFYHNNFINNTYQVNTNSTVKGSTGHDWELHHGGTFDNGAKGNYWSDYNGTDANRDGRGDSPYVIDSNRSDRYPLMSPFNISSIQFQLANWTYNTTYSFPEYPPEPKQENQTGQPEPFPVAPVAAASVATIAVVGACLLVYFKKRNHKP